MAATHIKVGSNTVQGSELHALVGYLREVQSRLAIIKSEMDTTVDGTDYSLTATTYAIPTAAEAQAVYNLVAGLKANLAADYNFLGLISRIGMG